MHGINSLSWLWKKMTLSLRTDCLLKLAALHLYKRYIFALETLICEVTTATASAEVGPNSNRIPWCICTVVSETTMRVLYSLLLDLCQYLWRSLPNPDKRWNSPSHTSPVFPVELDSTTCQCKSGNLQGLPNLTRECKKDF